MSKLLGVIGLCWSLSSFAMAADLHAAANDVCSCLEAPYQLAEQAISELQQAHSSGDYSNLMLAQGDMMDVMNAANQCFEQLPTKYPDIAQSDQLKAQVMAIAEQQCPNPAANFQYPNQQ